MRNMLSNEPLADLAAARRFLEEFLWDSSHINWHSEPIHFKRLKLIARQYCKIREWVKDRTTLAELLDWMVQSPHEVFNTPMIVVDNRRKPVAPESVTISDVDHGPINLVFRFFDIEGETLNGMGWVGQMIVKPPKGKRFDEGAWRFGLASYGIYLTSGMYDDFNGEDVWKFRFHILERDFKIEDADNSKWRIRETFHDLHGNSIDRATAFELGYLDDEIFGDGYAR